MNTFRIYQSEADNAIFDELIENDKCLVKMFCGTGKSRLMRYCRIAQGKPLVVYVVPSLSLLEQFYEDYLQDFPSENILRISSEEGSTTESNNIVHFLRNPENKIICITYQSFETLVHLLGNMKIDVCIFDEAHHVIGEKCQPLIFGSNFCNKQIFFTATPKNGNGIVMYDKDNLDAGMCGKLVYDYSYFNGVLEGYLNPFEIRIDFYTENTNASVYESIARAILASGNNRVLTFHADVNGDRDTSVLQFVDETEFIVAFNKVLHCEFPEKVGFYRSIQMVGLSAEIHMKTRKRILTQFDTTPENEVIVISSCQTIGEGIDTKNANMCVFVDPKSSFVAITQNIGRIVRKIFGQDKPNSTILIPCWVDKEKYLGCDGDKDKCDEVIREDINKGGNFNGILNVMSALKQEDEDMFDVCLNYPSNYSPQEIESNLLKHGYQLEEPTSLVESLEHLLDSDLVIDLEDESEESDEELLARTAEENNVTIEVHSDSLETPIEYYNADEGNDVIRIFRSYDEEMEETVYQPIVKKDGTKRNMDTLKPLRRENRFNVKVHTNPDVKVLWNLKDGFDLSRDICSCVIDCEVVKYDPLEVAQGIVERAKEREKNGSNLLPISTHKKHNRTTSEIVQEHKDAQKLCQWKSTLKGTGRIKIHDNVKEYLDELLPNWRLEIDWKKKAMDDAIFIVVRAKKRQTNGCNLMPKQYEKTNRKTKIIKDLNEDELQELKDARKLNIWKQCVNGTNTKSMCPENVRNYLDIEIPEWRLAFDKKALKEAHEIVVRSKIRLEKGGKLIPRMVDKKNMSNDELAERKDAVKLSNWKKALDGKPRCRCSDEVCNYLNKEIPGWRIHKLDKSMIDAQNIVLRGKIRQEKGEHLIPKQIRKEFRTTDDLKQEYKDATKLGDWKYALKNEQTRQKGDPVCCKEVCNYLDKEMPGWRLEVLEQSFQNVKDIVKRANERKLNGQNVMPKNIPTKNRLTDELTQQHKDAQKLMCLKKTIKGLSGTKCPDEMRDYLDKHLPGWRPVEDTPPQPEENETIEEIIVKPKQKKSAKLTKINPNPIKKEETKEETYIRTKPLITQFHNKFCKMRSDNLANHFQQNPSDFAEYHRVRDECFKTFEPEDIPCNRVIMELEKIKTKRGGKHVVDMGCGTAKISEHFKDDPRFHFINYDHVAINDTVQVCDISHMQLEDDSVDICIMSLALWGSNCEEYIKEAYRVLETNSTLYIIDSTKRWSEEGTQNATILKEMLETAGFQITTETIDKWCYFKGTKVPYNL